MNRKGFQGCLNVGVMSQISAYPNALSIPGGGIVFSDVVGSTIHVGKEWTRAVDLRPARLPVAAFDQLPHSPPGPVQLRFGSSNRPAGELSNLRVGVVFAIVQEQSLSVTARHLIEHSLQIDADDRSCQSPVGGFEFLARVDGPLLGFKDFVKGGLRQGYPPHSHQGNIRCQTIQPSRKGGFPSIGIDLAVEKKKGILGKIFCVFHVPGYAQTPRIHPAPVLLANLLNVGCEYILAPRLGRGAVGDDTSPWMYSRPFQLCYPPDNGPAICIHRKQFLLIVDLTLQF